MAIVSRPFCTLFSTVLPAYARPGPMLSGLAVSRKPTTKDEGRPGGTTAMSQKTFRRQLDQRFGSGDKARK